jgi:tRNA pseudouridine55 synthase
MITTQSGVLLIDKPVGPSSAQVVHRVKTILGAKKVGHLGTLDPFASGLLLIGVNEGTKVADIFLSGAKSYVGVMVLGVETDSQDCTGKVIETRAVPPVGGAELTMLESKFTGDLTQVPPMFSALKKDGVRLYQLARQGKEISREARAIRINALTLRQLSETEIEFEVSCSRGTYVRTLAADMGTELGCGAHLKTLRRSACGHLNISDALTPDELDERCASGESPLLSLRSALSHLPAVAWRSQLISRLRLGQQEVLAQLGRPREGEKLLVILDPRGTLVALAEWTEDVAVGRWRLARIFKE